MHLIRICVLLVFSVRSSCFIISFKSSIFLFIFCLVAYPLLKLGLCDFQLLLLNCPLFFQFCLFLLHVFWGSINRYIVHNWYIFIMEIIYKTFTTYLHYFSLLCTIIIIQAISLYSITLSA